MKFVSGPIEVSRTLHVLKANDVLNGVGELGYNIIDHEVLILELLSFHK